MNLITYDVLKKIATHIDPVRGAGVVNAINGVCPLYGINTPDILHEFLANVLEESDEFRFYTENLNYTAKRLMETWPKRFPDMAEAAQYANKPQALAEKVYGMRKDLGNTQAGDGWNFRGSGPIQMTGRSNFAAFTAWMAKKFNQIKTPQDWAEAIRTDHTAAMHSACWIFAISKQLIDEAERDEMTTIVKRINGGLNGLSKRMTYYELCKKYIA
jgi:putative chitinase